MNTQTRSPADTLDPPPALHAAAPVARLAPRRRHWPGLLAAAVVGAGVAAVLVSNYYDERTLGQRLDATIGSAGQQIQQQVDGIKAGASAVAAEGSNVSQQLAGHLSDATITAAVKTALAADPALSALKIDVQTSDRVVTLTGPAPDEQARERATVLAGAPDGVSRVDNRLQVSSAQAVPTASAASTVSN